MVFENQKTSSYLHPNNSQPNSPSNFVSPSTTLLPKVPNTCLYVTYVTKGFGPGVHDKYIK
ncbi:hypothetical protein GVAV_002779 [Gurleya vavrai]